MNRIRFACAVVLCWLSCMAVLAQSTNNGAWQMLQNGAVSVRVPADWAMQSSLNSVISPSGSTTISVTVTLLPQGTTLDAAVAQIAGSQSDVRGSNAVMLPAGAGWQLESGGTVNGQTVRTSEYLVLVDNVLVNLTGTTQDNNPDTLTSTLALFERIASTLTIDNTGAIAWLRYSDPSGKISLRAPEGWQQKSSGNQVLTVVEPQKTMVITLNYRPMSQPVILENAAQMLLDAYQEQNIPIAALEPESLPVGEAYRTLLTNIPAQAADTTLIQTQQYQYIVLREATLIVINAGCETEQFEQCKALLTQIIDTIEYHP